MIEQSCIACGSKYDYFEHSATAVCSQNQTHVVCRRCANDLVSKNLRCPHCMAPVRSLANLNQGGWAQPQPYTHAPYWQPAPIQPYIAQPGIVSNQGFIPQPYIAPHPSTLNYQKRSKIFCFFSSFFLVSAIIQTIIRILMQTCFFWGGRLDCGSYYGSKYCCWYSCRTISDWNCDYFYYVQNNGAVVGVTVGLAVCYALAVSFFVGFLRMRKMGMGMGVGGNYVGVPA